MEVEEKVINKHQDISKAEIALNIQLSKYLNIEGTTPELLEKIKLKIKQEKEESKIDLITMRFLINAYSKDKPFNVYIYKKLVMPLIDYLINERKTKSTPNITKIYDIFSNYFSNDYMLKILFDKSVGLLLKEELEVYLDILIPFILDKQTNSIISVLNNYLDKDITKLIDNLLDGLDTKSAKAFDFLKNILFIIAKLDENIFQKINDYTQDYWNKEKNEFLRCRTCCDFPILIIDENKKISMKYSCDHNENNIITPNSIHNSKLKCCDCKEEIHYIKKAYICSNCKHLICYKCKQKQDHFIKCLTIFFIPLSDIGLICVDHNSRFQTFCSICNKNLCSKCKEEHQHFSNYSEKFSIKEYKDKIDNYIKLGNKIEEPYNSLIKLILSDDKYLANFQFGYFIQNLVGEKSVHECGFFKEFGNKEFNDYYSTLIKEYKKANLFYFKIYQNIKNIYLENKLEINEHTIDLVALLVKNENDYEIYRDNGLKASLLVHYFFNLYDIKSMLEQEDNLLEKDKLNIKNEENKIKLNLLLVENNKYKAQIVQLLNRTIADYILRYLVQNYPHKFNAITLDLKMYNDIKENFKGDKEYVNNFENVKKDRINQLLDSTKNKLNNSGNNNEETEISEDYNNEIIFCDSIKKGNKVISVENLNLLLEYLFYLKDDGNSIAHPKDGNFIFSQTENDLYKDNEQIIKENQLLNLLRNSLLNLELKEKISKKTLLECIFTGKYDGLLSKINIPEIRSTVTFEKANYSNINEELVNEFRKIEETLHFFKLDYESLSSYNKNYIQIGQTTLKDFYSRLYKSIKEKDSALNLLRNILHFNYKNCLLGNMPSFTKGCFSYIIDNALKKDKDTIKKFEKSIEEHKKKRKENKILLEICKKLTEITNDYKNKEKENNQNSIINKFVSFINSKKKNNEKKVEYTEGKAICESIMENLELLLKETINWPKYNKQKLSSLLCLFQNQEK